MMNIEDSINEKIKNAMKEYDIPADQIKIWAAESMETAKSGDVIINLVVPEEENVIKKLGEFPILNRFQKDLL